MKIIKRASIDIKIEEAHGGSGARKVYADSSNSNLEAMTHGFLPAGQSFDWHDHDGVEEIVVVIKGSGKVADEDGEYDYAAGDVFIFPANVQHKITNPTEEEHEMIFVRVDA